MESVYMPYLIGVVLSLGVALFARCVGFDRDRAFYPTVLIASVDLQRADSVGGNSSNRAISTMPLCSPPLDLDRYILDRYADLLRNWRPNVHALSIGLDADH